MARRCLGRLPNDPSKPRVRLHRAATPTPPASVDYYSSVPASSWGMLGNDTVGDCTCAGAGHIIDQIEWYAQGNKAATVTTNDALSAYSAITGYTPSNPNSDQGAELQQVLTWWRKNPIAGYTVDAFAQIDASDTALLQQCVADFGSVYTGFEVPSSAMTQFDNGQPWTVARGRSSIEGGHCVPIFGYDATWLYCLTWGQVQKIGYDFYAKYFVNQQDIWVAINSEWLETTGITPSGLDVNAANSAYQSLTGDTASPFIGTNPTPTPTPTPTGNPDADLVTAFTTWRAAKGI